MTAARRTFAAAVLCCALAGVFELPVATAQIWFGNVLQPSSFFVNVSFDDSNELLIVPYLFVGFGTVPRTNATFHLMTAYPDATGCTPLAATDPTGRSYNGSMVMLDAGLLAPCAGSVQALNAELAGAGAVLMYVQVNTDFFATYGVVPVHIPAINFRAEVSKYIFDRIRRDPFLNVTVRFNGTGTTAPGDVAALQQFVAENDQFQLGRCEDINPHCGLRDFGDLRPSSPPAIRNLDPCLDRVSGVWCENNRIVALNLIYFNYRGAIPRAIGALTDLRYLILNAFVPSNNWQGAVPEEICQLTELQALLIDYSSISSLPECISQMRKLEFLTVSNNQLTSIPRAVMSLPELRMLDASFNRLLYLPGFNSSGESINLVNSLTPLTNWLPPNMEGFAVQANNIESPLYPVTGNRKLVIFEVSQNRLYATDLRSAFDGCSNLLILNLARNVLSGQLPTCLDCLKLRTLSVAFNSFYGELPREWEVMGPTLQTLTLSHNHLDVLPLDVLPVFLAMTSLDLSHNEFSVEKAVPKSIGCLDVGCIITIISNMPKLSVLNMEANRFDTFWGDGWATGETLIVLRLAYNNITNLPGDLFLPGFYAGFLLLDVSHNNLSGIFPSGSPWAQSAVLKFDGNPHLRGIGPARDQLPVWASFTGNGVLYEEGLYSCPGLSAPPLDLLTFDPSFYNYRGCKCSRTGFAGVAPDCHPCPEGSIANVNNTECVLCPAGQMNRQIAQTVCEVCPSGKFSDAPGASSCTDCAAGTYAPPSQYGQTACLYCVGKQYQPATAQVKCLTCEDDSYLVSRTLGTCALCPTGAKCLSNGVVQAAKGYFAVRGEDGEITVHQCLPEYCVGANETLSCPVLNEEDLFMPLESPDPSGTGPVTSSPLPYSTSQSCCAEGRVPANDNPLCGKCLPGMYEWSKKCVACERANGGIVFGFVMASWAYVIVFHFISQSTSPDTRIILNFVQLVVVFFGPNVPFVQFLSFFDFNIFKSSTTPTCVAPFSPIILMLTGVWVPLLCLGLLCLTLFLHWWLWRSSAGCCNCVRGCLELCARAENAHHVLLREPFSFSPYVRSFIALTLFSYNSITSTVILYFDCVEVGSDSFLAAFPAISCNSDEYTRLRILFYFLIAVVVIAVPAAVFVFLWYSARRGLIATEKERVARAESAARPADVVSRAAMEKHKSRFGVLFESYHPRRFFYEAVVIARRTTLISLAVLLGNDGFRRAYWLCGATVIFLFIHVLSGPFEYRIDNRHELIALTTLVLLAATLMVAPNPMPLNYSIGLTVLVLGVLLILVIPAIFTRADKLWRRFAGAEAVELQRRALSLKDLNETAATGAPHQHHVLDRTSSTRAVLDAAAAVAAVSPHHSHTVHHKPHVAASPVHGNGANGGDSGRSGGSGERDRDRDGSEFNRQPSMLSGIDRPPHSPIASEGDILRQKFGHRASTVLLTSDTEMASIRVMPVAPAPGAFPALPARASISGAPPPLSIATGSSPVMTSSQPAGSVTPSNISLSLAPAPPALLAFAPVLPPLPPLAAVSPPPPAPASLPPTAVSLPPPPPSVPVVTPVQPLVSAGSPLAAATATPPVPTSPPAALTAATQPLLSDLIAPLPAAGSGTAPLAVTTVGSSSSGAGRGGSDTPPSPHTPLNS